MDSTKVKKALEALATQGKWADHSDLVCKAIEGTSDLEEAADKAIMSRFAILVVDDDEDFLHMTRKIMGTMVSNIFTANDGYEAIVEIGGNMVDLLITDLMMPKIDGVFLTKFMKKRFPNVKLIVYSGDPEQQLEGVDTSEIAHILKKPIDMNELKRLAKMTLLGS